ncbi:MAG: hypothetical protein M0R70_12795 [Nitrospirae bacterium]|nr:hypothetical protein [Nitrospirota bacterium]
MEMQSPKMFTCEKYNVTMLASKAAETCAKRFETSLHGHFHNFDKCRTCKRGAVLYEAGKHKTEGRETPDKILRGQALDDGRKGETNQAKAETIQAKGETTMATNAKGTCSTKDCGRTVQKDGLCYKCYKAKHGCAPYPGQDHKKGIVKVKEKTRCHGKSVSQSGRISLSSIVQAKRSSLISRRFSPPAASTGQSTPGCIAA